MRTQRKVATFRGFFSFLRQWVQVATHRLRSLAQLVRTALWSLWGDSGGEVEWP